MARAATYIDSVEPATPAETWRLRAVQIAWSLIRKHPNWYRNHGFSVEASGWTAFLASIRDLKDQIQARMEREMEWQRCEERPTDVDCQEAIVIAVHLLQAGRRPGWPLPSGAIVTWEAMSFLFVDAFGTESPAADVAEQPVSRVLKGEGWCVDLEQLSRRHAIH